MTGLFVIVFIAALVGVFKPYINGAKRWQFGLGAFVAFILIGAFAEPSSQSNNVAGDATANSSDPTGKAPAVATAVANEPESAWSYSSEKDEMRGAESHYAELDATNTINLDFPYGEQRGRILVRQSAQFGFDILVGVPSGQIMCNSFSNSHINVKFDEGPIQRYGCTDASDGTSDMIFIQGSKGFLSKLKKSKKAVVEAEFFQNGMQQMTFNTANLNWEH
ncbi:Putative membrane protein [Sphingopyxis fribergensis]|uniref:Putative membrane protein n=1 Tax=Sphingopyxis fribergensis TaxID=1515612 RepID=A0A0A7PFS0_9SPHN|nr:hypothetical protein [Sphingopyxis fribergensis]AJA08850.1 Putative membrane protein [Sphingopyxis fribergensis]